MQIEFVKDKETKNTVRFTATGDVAGSLYVRKGTELANEDKLVIEVVAEQPA